MTTTRCLFCIFHKYKTYISQLLVQMKPNKKKKPKKLDSYFIIKTSKQTKLESVFLWAIKETSIRFKFACQFAKSNNILHNMYEYWTILSFYFNTFHIFTHIYIYSYTTSKVYSILFYFCVFNYSSTFNINYLYWLGRRIRSFQQLSIYTRNWTNYWTKIKKNVWFREIKLLAF